MLKSNGNAKRNTRDILIRGVLRELGRLYHLFFHKDIDNIKSQ